jgi:WD40 repeat protein/tetratricopeptide (TPR) repeat protein
MSPETVSGQSHKATTAVDVYSLGVILYELLTGKPPFQAPTPVEVVYKVLHEEVAPPSRLQTHIARDLEVICLKCLQREPAARYGSAENLAEDLERFVAGEAIAARAVSSSERIWKWTRRNPGSAALIGVIGALATALIVGITISSIVWRQQRDDLRDREKDVRTQRDRAVIAEIESREKLYQSYLAEARGTRASRKIGQRWGALDAVVRAREVLAQLDLTDAERQHRLLELRSEAIAAMALPDLRHVPRWVTMPEGSEGTQNNWDVSPDGKYFVANDATGPISVRRVADHPEDAIEVDRIQAAVMGSIAFWSNHGAYIVAAFGMNDGDPAKRKLGVWSFREEKLSPVFERPTGAIDCQVGFSDDESVFVEATNGIIRVYELPSGRQLHQIPAPIQNWGANLARIPFHPHNPHAYLIGREGIYILDWKRGSIVATTARGYSTPSSLALHPDGETLYLATRPVVAAWSLIDGREKFRMTHDDDGMVLTLNPSGDVLAGTGWAGRTFYWNAHNGHVLFEHNGMGTFRILAGDRLVSFLPAELGALRARIKEFNPAREFRVLKFAVGSQTKVFATRFSLHPSGRMLAVGSTLGTSLLDVDTGSERRLIGPPLRGASYFGPTGALISAASGECWEWPVAFTREPNVAFKIGPPTKMPVAFSTDHTISHSRDGAVVSGSNFDGAMVWHRGTDNRVVRLLPHDDCRSSATSPDGKYVATGSHSYSGLRIWEAATGKLVKEVLSDTFWTMPTFSPDNQWLTDWRGLRWRVGDWTPGTSLRQLPGMAKRGTHAFSPDGSLIAVDADEGVIVLLDATGEKEIARLTDPNQLVANHMEFTSDGSKLISLSIHGRELHVWDLRLIRERLNELGLDWELPAYPAARALDPSALLQVNVEHGELGTMADRQLAETILDRRPRSTQDALTPAERAVKNGPSFARNWLVRGRVHLRNRKFDAAIRDLEEFLELAGPKPDDWYEVAWLAVREPGHSTEVYRKAREWAEKAVAANPLKVNYQTCLAAALYRGDDYMSARANLHTCLALSLVTRQDANHAAYLLAMVQYRLSASSDHAGRTAARKLFDSAEAAFRRRSNHPVDLADLRLEAADVVDAPRLRFELTVYDKTVQLTASPNDVAARSLRASSYSQLGLYSEAEADDDALIAAGTKSPQPNHYRGHAREHQLKLSDALADYESALRLTADSLRIERAHLLNEIARIRLLGDEKLRDAAEGLRRAEQAVALDPAIEAYSVMLGIAHFRNDNDKTALRVLQNTDDRRIATSAVLPLKYLFLAMAQQRLRLTAEAKANHEKAESLSNRLGKPAPEWIEYFRRCRAEAAQMFESRHLPIK